jgi:CHAT domain-containing protein/tetratricopeptide (TPR) repeat protein
VDLTVTSDSVDESLVDEVNATFAECGAFVRDTTLPDRTLGKYRVGVLLREPTFCDASHKLGGFVAPHRYLIFSSQARSLDELAPQPWGLCVWQRGRVFKVIDRLTDGERVQITLLEIPDHLLGLFLRIEPNPIEQAFIEHGRGLFADCCLVPPVPELDADEWRNRLVYPVGVDDEGRYFALYDAADHGDDQSRPLVAEVVAYVARVLTDAGAYADADALLSPALEAQRPFEERDPDPVAALLVAHAELRAEIGDLKGAEGDLHDAFALRKRLAEDRLPVADVLSRLGHLYQQSGDDDAAERFYLHALKIRRRAAGERAADVLPSLVSLGALYERTDRCDQAEAYLREAVMVTRDVDVPEDPTLLNNLARLQHATGRFDEALESYERALVQVDRRAGAGRQRTLLQANLAELLAARGELEKSFELFTDVLERQREMIADVASFASERQRMDLLRDLRVRVSQYVSLVLAHFGDSPAHVRRAADLVLDRKALGADLLARQREAVLSARYPELREQLERLAELRAWIAQRSLAGPDASAEPVEEELRQAGLNREALERELAREIPELAARQLERTADCAAVAGALPTRAVVIEFLRYGVFNFAAVRNRGDDPWRPPHYLAIIIAPGPQAKPALIDVGDAARVDELVAAVRSQIAGAQEGAADAARDVARLRAEPAGTADGAAGLLRAAVFDPLTEAIGAADRLLLAPDGGLLLLPFGVLPGQDGRQLIDEYTISYLTAARDVVRLGERTRLRAGPPLVIAAPDYDAGAVTPEGEPFRPLPGTWREGKRVAELLSVRPLLGAEAVKTALEACRAPRVLHLATHGFFLPPERPLPADEFAPGMTVRGIDPDRQTMVLDGTVATPMQFVVAGDEAFERLSGHGLRSPLLRAGLALAGANTWLHGDVPPAAAGNGILTAEEVTGLDLSGTELVVLSACETGLGEVEPGEGVFGFRRSFVLAGARTVVLSLWKVADEQTRELMEDFYRLLQDGYPRAEALREAQLHLRARHPSASSWAAFICQGDDGPQHLPAGSE